MSILLEGRPTCKAMPCMDQLQVPSQSLSPLPRQPPQSPSIPTLPALSSDEGPGPKGGNFRMPGDASPRESHQRSPGPPRGGDADAEPGQPLVAEELA